MAVTQVIEALTTPERLPVVGAVVVAVVAAAVVPPLIGLRSDPLAAFPHLNTEAGSETKQRADYMARAAALYAEGYRKFTEGAFRLTTSRRELLS